LFNGASAVEAGQANNPKVAGSSPAPATKKDEADSIESAFCFGSDKSNNNIVMNNKATDPNLQSILISLQELPPNRFGRRSFAIPKITSLT
jgi:hypothetical protein